MPAGDVVELSGRQVEHSVEHREVEPGELVGLEQPVELGGNLGGCGHRDPAVGSLPNQDRGIRHLGNQEATHGHRHQRGGYAVAADIHDEQPHPLLVQGKYVEEVAGEAVAGNVSPGDPERRQGDVVRGQQRPLDLGRRFEIANHLGVVPGDFRVEDGQFFVGLLQAVAGD